MSSPTITLYAANLSALVTETPPLQFITLNGVENTDITNLYNLSTDIKTAIDNGATSLTYQEANAALYFEYVSELKDTDFTPAQLCTFIDFIDTNHFVAQVFLNVYTGIEELSSPISVEPACVAKLFVFMDPSQKVELVLNHFTEDSLTSLALNDYLLLATQKYISTATFSAILANQNYSFAERITLIGAGRANANMDAFSKLVIDDLGTYYIRKTFYDNNANNEQYYYFINITSWAKTLNSLPPGASTITVVTALSKAQYQTLLDSVVTNDERSLSTLLFCVYQQNVVIT